MTNFLYTIETPDAYNGEGSEVYTNDLQKAMDFALEMSQEWTYSCVRNNDTGEIEEDFGDIIDLVERGIV
tara:strand:+ start:824 stop:1033 length:210 start_codon:yes stop_codon:yes gene_type:complete